MGDLTMKHYFDKHWYDNHPEILEAEKSAMYEALRNATIFIIRNDQYACWHIYGDHEMELVYTEDGIRTYFVNPTLEEMLQMATCEYGIEVKNLPYFMRDAAGRFYLALCDAKDYYPSYRYPIAAEHYKRAKKWIYFFEWNIKNPDKTFTTGSLACWSVKKIEDKKTPLILQSQEADSGNLFSSDSDYFKNVHDLIEKIKKSDEGVLQSINGVPHSITCTCKRCHRTTEINWDDRYRTKFLRCSECGYVMGPAFHHVPKTYVYIVHDETNIIEPEKWFGDEADAKEYVAFCGLSEKQIHRKYAIP